MILNFFSCAFCLLYMFFHDMSVHVFCTFSNWIACLFVFYSLNFENSLYMLDASHLGFPGGSDGKASVCNAGNMGSIPGFGRSSGEGNGTPLQYSWLENPMDGGAWWAAVHGVARSRTRLRDFTSIDKLLPRFSSLHQVDLMGEQYDSMTISLQLYQTHMLITEHWL